MRWCAHACVEIGNETQYGDVRIAICARITFDIQIVNNYYIII